MCLRENLETDFLLVTLRPSLSLQWRHNGVSNHQPHDCLLNRLVSRRSEKTSKLRDTGLCEGNSPRTGEFPAQIASNAENVSIWRTHPEFRVVVPTQSSVLLVVHRRNQEIVFVFPTCVNNREHWSILYNINDTRLYFTAEIYTYGMLWVLQ